MNNNPLPQDSGIKKFFYSQGSKSHGPYSMVELREKARQGVLLPGDIVWIRGQNRRLPAKMIPWLFAASQMPILSEEAVQDAEKDPRTEYGSDCPRTVTMAVSYLRSAFQATAAHFLRVLEILWLASLFGNEKYQAWRIRRIAEPASIDLNQALGEVDLLSQELRKAWGGLSGEDSRNRKQLITGYGISVVLVSLLFGALAQRKDSHSSLLAFVHQQAMATHGFNTGDTVSQKRMEPNHRESDRAKEVMILVFEGQKLMEQRKYQLARMNFEKALDKDSRCVDASIGLSEAYLGMGDRDRARDALNRAIHRVNKNLPLQRQLVERVTQISGDRRNLLIPVLESAISSEPQNPDLRYECGVACVKNEQFERAEPHLEIAVELLEGKPDLREEYINAMYHLAVARKMNKKLKAAIGCCNRLISVQPNHVQGRILRAQLSAMDKNENLANSDFTYLATQANTDPGSLGEIAQLMLQKRMFGAAVQSFGSLIESDPNNVRWFHSRAIAHMFLNEPDLATKDCLHALKLTGDDINAQSRLMDLKKTLESMKSRGLTYEQFSQQKEREEQAAMVNPRSTQPSFPSSRGEGSGYSYYSTLSPYQAGKLGVLGIGLPVAPNDPRYRNPW